MASKSADQSISNNNTLFDDADLQISLEANSTYLIDGFLIFLSPAAADIKFSIKAIAGATSYWGFSYDTTPTAKALGDVAAIPTDASTQWIWMHGIIRTGAAGSFILQWAQNTADAGTTKLYQSSYIAATKV